MDDYEQIGPVAYVPDAPSGSLEAKSTPAVKTATPATKPPLRDDDIDLTSFPPADPSPKVSEKNKQPTESGSTGTTERKSKSQKRKKEIKKKAEETKAGEDRRVCCKVCFGLSLVSMLVFCCLTVFVGGHRWFGLHVIEALTV